MVCVDVKKSGSLEGAEGATVATQRSPDLQESSTKQNSTVCIIGVNKIATNFVTLVATYRVFHDFRA